MFSRYEGTPITVKVECYSKENVLTDPSESMTYQVIDKLTKTVLQSGSVDTPEHTEEILIEGINNIIINQARAKERKMVIVTVDGQTRGVAEYEILNVRSIGNESS